MERQGCYSATLVNRNYQLMSQTEFLQMHDAYRIAPPAKARRLFNRMIWGNMQLVASVAFKYQDCGVPFDDVLQEGAIGLARALTGYKEDLGALSTYAPWWIRQNIERLVQNEHAQRGFRIPVHYTDSLRKIRHAVCVFETQHGRIPNALETYQAVKNMEERRRKKLEEKGKKVQEMDFRTVVRLLRHQEAPSISLNDACQKDSARTVQEILPDHSVSVHASAEASENLHAWETLHERGLRPLSDFEREILLLRTGIEVDQELTLLSLKKRFGLSRECIRQFEATAIKRYCGSIGITPAQFPQFVRMHEELLCILMATQRHAGRTPIAPAVRTAEVAP